jgi:hypothetical protein
MAVQRSWGEKDYIERRAKMAAALDPLAKVSPYRKARIESGDPLMVRDAESNWTAAEQVLREAAAASSDDDVKRWSKP